MTGQGIVTNQPRVAIWKSGLGRRGESESESECEECVGHEQQRHEQHEATNEKDEAAKTKLLLFFLLFSRPRSFEYQAREID